MVHLLIADSRADTSPMDQTAFGGLPSARSGQVSWPVCQCKSPMQFLGQLRAQDASGDRLLLLFMCQAKPGLCDEWDANAGGNAVLVVGAGQLESMPAPGGENVVRATRYGAFTVPVEAASYDDARSHWASSTGQAMRQVLGQLGGQPSWIQGDETPSCDQCGEGMAFVAQLEEGPDHQTAMNFGGGCAYVFQCARCDASAKLLWQC